MTPRSNFYVGGKMPKENKVNVKKPVEEEEV